MLPRPERLRHLRRHQRPQDPGLEHFSGLVDVEEPFPLTFIEQYALTEATAELATSCYAGVLMLQALGLGGWMFDGIDRFSMLGASGNPEVPGLGFRYDQDERWAVPNPTGRDGVFAAYCPPHYPDMAAAVEAFAERKYGTGGPFNSATLGAWSDSPGFAEAPRSMTPSSRRVSRYRRSMSSTRRQVSGTVPTIFIMNYVQPTIWTSSSTTDSSSRAHTCAPTPSMQRWHSQPPTNA